MPPAQKNLFVRTADTILGYLFFNGGKVDKATQDRAKWCSTVTRDTLLAGYTTRLMHGARPGLDVRCYSLLEIDQVKQIFAIYANENQVWTEESLCNCLTAHAPDVLKVFIQRSKALLFRCLLGAARFPFQLDAAECRKDLQLDDVLRAFALLTYRDGKLLSGKELSGTTLLRKRSREGYARVFFQCMAASKLASIEQNHINSETTDPSTGDLEDIIDVLVATQPTYPKLIYLQHRPYFQATAERLQSNQAYSHTITQEDTQHLLELYLAILKIQNTSPEHSEQLLSKTDQQIQEITNTVQSILGGSASGPQQFNYEAICEALKSVQRVAFSETSALDGEMHVTLDQFLAFLFSQVLSSGPESWSDLASGLKIQRAFEDNK